ncbi:hypothetical protein GW17_00048769 [Ensete ventricosum]|nr:hypothetical protein GW17_00048769 [Ensete ventricosum]RZR94430.1 hypothetical protein BHM03_00023117 [Ensete ventricosum]
MEKHYGESSKMGQAGPLPQAAASELQVQTRSQAVEAAHEESGSEQDEREVGILSERRRRIMEPQPGKGATRRGSQWRKLTSMFLKRAWRNSTEANEGSLG